MNSEDKQRRMSAGPFAAVLAALDRHQVEYIVIGGQAVVAYGASQFTRDADFWVNPTPRNVSCLRKTLDEIGAVPRFLPPLKLGYLKKGHGIHFRFRYGDREFLLDFLGKPPRVSGFRPALKEALPIRWHGVSVPILDIVRLVATKKTDRDKDYLVIRLLTDMVFKQARKGSKDRNRAMPWLARESRNPLHLLAMAKTWPEGKNALLNSRRPAAMLAATRASVHDIEKALQQEQEKLKSKNREYGFDKLTVPSTVEGLASISQRIEADPETSETLNLSVSTAGLSRAGGIFCEST